MHLLAVHLRTGLQLWAGDHRLHQSQMHVFTMHLRAELFLRH